MPTTPQFEIIFTHGAGTYTITEASNQRVLNREYARDENFPAKITLTLENGKTSAGYNLLHASCSVWTSGTGPLSIGDQVSYSIYPTSTGTKTTVFAGFVKRISQVKQTLKIECVDWLAQYEEIFQDRIFYANYRDQLAKAKAYDYTNKRWEITGMTDSQMILPMVAVEMTANKELLQISDTREYDSVQSLTTGPIAQAFTATKELFESVFFEWKSAGTTNRIRVSIREDDGSGNPSSSYLYQGDYTCLVSGSYYEGFVGADTPIPLKPGAKYWIHFSTPDATNVWIGVDGSPTYDPYPDYKYYTSAWNTQSDDNLLLKLVLSEWGEVDAKDYTVDETADELRFVTTPNGSDFDYMGCTTACRLSYYYGHIHPHDALHTMVLMETLNHTSIDDMAYYATKEFPIYRTNGRSLLECFQEIVNGFNCYVSSAYYQGTVTAHRSSTTVYFGRRKVVGVDTSSFTFATSSGTDSQLRIIDYNLSKEGRRPGTILVVGKDVKGNAIVTQLDDRTLGTSSFRTKSKLTTQERVQDDGITTLSQADDVAIAAYERMTRDVWEGDIMVSGVYPDLFNMTASNETQGSGAIITLNIPELGISSENFKVSGIICYPAKTLIKLSNVDVFLDNKVNLVSKKTERLESTTGPVGPYRQFFIAVYSSDTFTNSSLYMELQDASGTAIGNQTRQLCYRRSIPRLKQSRYQGSFEIGNAWTTDGTNLVGRIALWSALTGGTQYDYVQLNAGQQIPKWKTTRLIVEYMTYDGT